MNFIKIKSDGKLNQIYDFVYNKGKTVPDPVLQLIKETWEKSGKNPLLTSKRIRPKRVRVSHGTIQRLVEKNNR